MRLWITALLAALLVFVPASSSVAQRVGGVFDQPYESSPFAALTPGQASLAITAGGQIGNNTLNIGDLFAINELSDHFRFNDLFLIGGLIPRGEGLLGDAYADARVSLSVPITDRLDIAVGVGGRGYGDLQVPEELATFVRDGVSGAPLEIDLTRFQFSTLEYTEIGGLAVYEVPTPFLPPSVRLRVGAGGRYLRGIGFGEISFDGDGVVSPGTLVASGKVRDEPVASMVTVSHDGIVADVTSSVPLDFTTPGGSGYALDLMASANIGRLHVGVTAWGIGRLEARRGPRAVGRLTYAGTSVRDFFNALDRMPTDTLRTSAETLTVPRTLRFETSYELRPNLTVGGAFERRSGDVFATSHAFTALAELKPRPWLPVRLGAVFNDGAGPALVGGFGLDLRVVRFESIVAMRGGIAPDKYSRAHARVGFSIPLFSRAKPVPATPLQRTKRK